MKLIKCRKYGRYVRVIDNGYCLSKCTGCGSTDLEETIYKLDGSNIDWEERRYEIAKTVLPKMLDYLTASGTISQDAIEDNRATRNAVFFADALIAELKKTNETK
jgi:hypothetical protein